MIKVLYLGVLIMLTLVSNAQFSHGIKASFGTMKDKYPEHVENLPSGLQEAINQYVPFNEAAWSKDLDELSLSLFYELNYKSYFLELGLDHFILAPSFLIPNWQTSHNTEMLWSSKVTNGFLNFNYGLGYCGGDKFQYSVSIGASHIPSFFREPFIYSSIPGAGKSSDSYYDFYQEYLEDPFQEDNNSLRSAFALYSRLSLSYPLFQKLRIYTSLKLNSNYSQPLLYHYYERKEFGDDPVYNLYLNGGAHIALQFGLIYNFKSMEPE